MLSTSRTVPHETSFAASGPLFVIQGDSDPLIPTSHGERIAGLGTGQVICHLVPGGNHGGNNLCYRALPKANDWLVRKLGGKIA